ncbi:DUF397 domain-containing protein [Actinophytocola algeriensis]|jgi:hypothetical protein|uniref:DUF397 domain-containing protein n=1 Tax=Actinophytocola algeriensis TaxID=1768010 RepID=A0A7W7QE23_9PSEU|nr:DUF397 domain-containing protein [Actinophytocola algeriensis]MBB4911860.1 hypothetical protein [Actinophytocola algeriensis]MBE1477648.1 hypothetical protein [Actinophytocola algeriensis]
MMAPDLSRLVWHRSSRSGGGRCVEVASIEGVLAMVRDSKDPAGPVLAFPVSSWTSFLSR